MATDPRLARFVEEYTLDWNGTQAALRAGGDQQDAWVLPVGEGRTETLSGSEEGDVPSLSDAQLRALIARQGSESTTDEQA